MGFAMQSSPSYTQGALPHSLIKPFKPHGKYAGVVGSSVPIPDSGILVSESCRATVRLRKDKLGGKEITYISKFAPEGPLLYQELYMYSHPELLRPLQGTCVSFIIGVSEPQGGRVAVALEMPHHIGWKEVDSYEPKGVKEAVISAYQTLHSRGILHGRVQNEHILRANDERIVLLDFTSSATIEDHTAAGIRRCTQTELENEMQQVKVLVGYIEGAGPSLSSNGMPMMFHGIHGRIFEVPEDKRSEPWESSLSTPTTTPQSPSTPASPSATPPLQAPSLASSESLSVARDSPRRAGTPIPIPKSPLQPGAVASNDSAHEPPANAGPAPLHIPSSSQMAKKTGWVDDRGHPRVAFHPNTDDNSLWTGPGYYNSRARQQKQLLQAAEAARPPVVVNMERHPTPTPDASSARDTPPLTYREPEPYRQSTPPQPTDAAAAEPVDEVAVRIVITAPTGEECIWGVSKELGHEIQKILEKGAGKALPRGAETAALKRKADDAEESGSTSKKNCAERSHSNGSGVALMAPPSAGPSAPRKRKAGDVYEAEESEIVPRTEERSSKRSFLASPLQRTVPVS